MRQNSDYHYSGDLRSSYLAGWSYWSFEGPDTSNVSIAGFFSCNLCYGFEPEADFRNHIDLLGSPAAESENQFVVYIYISVEK